MSFAPVRPSQYRRVPPAGEFTRLPRVRMAQNSAGALDRFAANCMRELERLDVLDTPAQVARVQWSHSHTLADDPYAMIPAHPAARHRTAWGVGPFAPDVETSATGLALVTTARPLTSERFDAACAGELSLFALAGPLPRFYIDQCVALLARGLRFAFGLRPASRPNPKTAHQRLPDITSGRYIAHRRLIFLYLDPVMDPAFSLALIIDYLWFIAHTEEAFRRVGMLFPTWMQLPEAMHNTIEQLWIKTEVYMEALAHAKNLRTQGYRVDGHPWDEWQALAPASARKAIARAVMTDSGLLGLPWAKDFLRILERHSLLDLLNGS